MIDPAQLSEEEILASMWHGGDLSTLMHDGQRRLRDRIHEWRKIDQTNDVNRVKGSMPRVFCIAKAGRFGGTTAMMWILYEIATEFAREHNRPMFLRFTSAWQKAIDEIIGAIVPQCFETAPESCKPHYFGKRGTKPAGLYWPEYGPTGGLVIALAGLDVNPDATRGQASDGDVISEAAFVGKLDYTLRSVLYRQYQGRPWARGFIESSAPKDLDTDWERIYVPDCQRRHAYFSATIEDNSRLSQQEIDEFISAAGGRGDPNCEREYFNAIVGDPVMRCFPEFSKDTHVKPMEMPTHAVCITADDPGYRHLYGKVWAYYDFDAAKLVVQDSWAGSNSSSSRSACVSAAREFDLWGTWPPTQMKNIPLESDGDAIGWREYLKGDRCEKHVDELHRMASIPADKRPDWERRPGHWILNDFPGHLTYWDGVEHRRNPQARISDVDLRLIRDMDDLFGLDFMATTKEELRVMVNLVRNWLGDGRLVFLPEAGPVIEHVNACKWHKDRRHFDEHPVHGHYDAASCIVYLVRYAQQIEAMRPYPPSQVAAHSVGQNVQTRLPWQAPEQFELELRRRMEESRRMKPARNMLRTR